MKDAIGQDITIGCTVAHSSRRGSSLSITRRTVHSVDPKKGVRMFKTEGYAWQGNQKDTDEPSGSWANGSSMVVVKP